MPTETPLSEGLAPAFTPRVMLSDKAREITRGWESYPALRSDRAQAIFRRLRPRIKAPDLPVKIDWAHRQATRL